MCVLCVCVFVFPVVSLCFRILFAVMFKLSSPPFCVIPVLQTKVTTNQRKSAVLHRDTNRVSESDETVERSVPLL